MKYELTVQPNYVAFQGAPGAYSDLACRLLFPETKTVPCASFDDAFESVIDGVSDLAVIPIDNSLAGRVADVHHLLPGSGLSIIGEVFLPIRHCLLGLPDAVLEHLTTVHSHVHALPQCRKSIRELGLKPIVHADTAGAAAQVAAEGNSTLCAIASSLAAEIYGLKILKENLQDDDTNTTRFIVLSRTPAAALPDDTKAITSLIFKTKNVPASLHKALGCFANHQVNLTKLESYVDRNFQVAEFYIDLDGHHKSTQIENALYELSTVTEKITLLGCYPAHPFRDN